MFVSVAGIGLCLAAVVQFVFRIVDNALPWTKNSSIREHYLAVGQSYTQGFTAGFFLCFFLAVAAIAIGNRLGSLSRGAARAARRSGPVSELAQTALEDLRQAR